MRSQFATCVVFAVIAGNFAIAQDHVAQSVHSISINGVDRNWRMFVPDQFDSGVALPLVLNFHGSGSTPEQQAQISVIEGLAAEEGFFVASPEGIYRSEGSGRPSWNVDLSQEGVDDVRFVQKLIVEISNQFSIDPNRIYATGFSGGGRLSSRLACDLSDQLAAIGPVAGLRYPEDCNASRPVPVITFHGKNDPVNHYEYQTDSPGYWRMGVEEAISGWIQNNNCEAIPVEELVSETVIRVSYRECQDGADVVFYRSEDGGHTWPGSPYAPTLAEMGMGVTNSEIAATDLIWEFFENHPLQ
jgi:polyhydroxybutyrate depolymerase